MTVSELKSLLSRYPDDWKVVLDTSRDYEEYSEVKKSSKEQSSGCELVGG